MSFYVSSASVGVIRWVTPCIGVPLEPLRAALGLPLVAGTAIGMDTRSVCCRARSFLA